MPGHPGVAAAVTILVARGRERLILPKNSVQYRVRKAEEALGHPVDDNRLHLELALLASQ